jgi:hypothetical protein
VHCTGFAQDRKCAKLLILLHYSYLHRIAQDKSKVRRINRTWCICNKKTLMNVNLGRNAKHPVQSRATCANQLLVTLLLLCSLQHHATIHPSTNQPSEQTMSIQTKTNERNSIVAAFILSAVLFVCLGLTGCGGGEPDPSDPEYVAEQTPVSSPAPNNQRPTNPCANPEACK